VRYQVLDQRWHDFYLVSGTAAATLVGLLFVGLSLHLRAVLTRPDVRSLARITLSNFALVLFVSLFMVIREPSSAASSQLIGAGLVTVVVTAPSLVAAGRSRARTPPAVPTLIAVRPERPGIRRRHHLGSPTRRWER
jgi:hypothetical protein